MALSLSIVDAIEPERTSAAHAYVAAVEEGYHFREAGDFRVEMDSHTTSGDASETWRNYLRWNLESPLAESALIHATSYDPVVNMSILTTDQTVLKKTEKEGVVVNVELEDKDKEGKERWFLPDLQDAYARGNRVPRSDIYETIHESEDLDAVYRKQYREGHKASRIDAVCHLVQRDLKDRSIDHETIRAVVKEHVDFGDHKDYLGNRIFHGFIEKTLSFVTGLNSEQLDRCRRFDKPRDFCKMVYEKLRREGVTREAILAQLEKEGITQEPLRRQIANIMMHLIDKMKAERANSPTFRYLVDNWPQDRKFHDTFRPIFSDDGDDYKQFGTCDDYKQFVKQHKTLYVMTGLKKSATPIEDKQVFSTLQEVAEKIDIVHSKRKLALFELLDPKLKQYSYEPVTVPGYDDATVEKLFKMGLVGAYITSEKIVG
ncbi:MAG: hypothetical protein ACD_44C00185G0001, partial [uncultured bacterium]